VDGLPGSARAAADILGAMGDHLATAALAAALRARPAVGVPVARALGALRDPAAALALLGALGDPRLVASPGVREACLRALASLPAIAIDANAGRLIDAAARDPDSDVRVAALELASAVRTGLSRATLEAALREPDFVVRRAAVRAAAAMPALEATPLLLAMLAAAPVSNRNIAGPSPTAVRFSAAEEQQLAEAAADALEGVAQAADRPRLDEALARAPVTHRPALQRALQALDRRQAQTSWLRVRLRRPDGSPLAGRTFALATGRGTSGSGGTIRGRTDGAGEALVAGLPGPGPYVLSVDSAAQAARTDATLSGKSPAITPELPRARDASVPAQP